MEVRAIPQGALEKVPMGIQQPAPNPLENTVSNLHSLPNAFTESNSRTTQKDTNMYLTVKISRISHMRTENSAVSTI